MTSVASVAPLDRRVLARVITSAVGGVLGLVAQLAPFALLAVFSGNAKAAIIGLVLVALTVAGYGWMLWLTLAKAQTVGYRALGLVACDAVTGAPAGGKLFLRSLLQGLVSMVTLLVGEAVISYVTFENGRNWFDRVAGTIVVPKASVTPSGVGGFDTGEWQTSAGEGVGGAHVPTYGAPGRTEMSPDVGGVRPPTAVPVASEHSPINAVPARGWDQPAASVSGSGPNAPEPLLSPPAPNVVAPPAWAPAAPAVTPPVPAPTGPGGDVPDGAVPVGMITTPPWPGSPPSAPPTPPPVAPERERPVLRSMAPEPAPDHTVLDLSVAAAASGLRLRFDDGTEHRIVAPLVLGRDPVVPAGLSDGVALPVDDPQLRVSKTHLVVAEDNGRLTVLDLHSTNGVGVAPPGGLVERLPAGEAVPVTPGSRVFLGSRWFEVST